MTALVTLVNRHQPLLLARTRYLAVQRPGQQDASITLESHPRPETNTVTLIRPRRWILVPSLLNTPTCPCPCPCPFPAPACKATEVLHAAPILFFFLVTVSRTLLVSFRLFGRSVPPVL
jgi:hypothetical protein